MWSCVVPRLAGFFLPIDSRPFQFKIIKWSCIIPRRTSAYLIAEATAPLSLEFYHAEVRFTKYLFRAIEHCFGPKSGRLRGVVICTPPQFNTIRGSTLLAVRAQDQVW